MDPREQQRRIVLSRGESVEGTIDSMRKESSVQQFITIREMERRQSQAHEEKKARIIESKKKAAAAKVKLVAAAESADLAMIEKAVAAALRKKTTLLDRLGHVSGHWAARVTSDLSKIEGVTDAAKTMQRAARVQVRASLKTDFYCACCWTEAIE